jgi:O-antigen/teichoic acid export membrane protein
MTSITKPTIILMTGRALGVAVSLCIPVVLARTFDQAAFGTYKQFLLIHATLYVIAQFGLAESLFYFVPSEPNRAGRYTLNAMLVLAGAGAACFLLFLPSGSVMARGFNNPALRAGVPLIGLYLALMLASAFLEMVLTARKRFALAAFTYAATDISRTILFLVPALWFRSLEGLLYGAVASGALRLAATVFYLRAEFGGSLRPDLPLLRRQLAYALPFEAAVLLDVAQTNLHQYVVAWHFDAATFAIYAVGCLQVPLVDLVAGSTCNVMMVKMAEDLRDGRHEAVLASWHGTIRKLALVFFPLVGLLILTARELIVLLFTESYLASVPIFMAWTVSFLLFAFPVDGFLRVFADTRALLLLGTIRVVLIAVSVNWFLGRFGLIGAVLVTLLASVAAKGFGLARVKRHLNATLPELMPWSGLVAALVAASAAGILAWTVKAGLDLAPWPLMLATSLVYAVAYLGVCGALGGSGLRSWLAAPRSVRS